MYWLFLEIKGWRTRERIDPAGAGELKKELFFLFKRWLPGEIVVEKNLFLVQYNPATNTVREYYRTAWELQRYLTGREELHGFLILLGRENEALYETYSTCIAQDIILVNPSLMEEASLYFELEPAESGSAVQDYKGDVRSGLDSGNRFLINKSLVNRIGQFLVPEIGTELESYWIHIEGPPAGGLRHLMAAIRACFPEDLCCRDLPVVQWDLKRQSLFEVISSSIDNIFTVFGGKGGGPIREEWKKRLSSLENRESVSDYEGLQPAVRYLMTFYAGECKMRGLPAVFLIEDISRLSKDLKQEAENLIETLMKSGPALLLSAGELPQERHSLSFAGLPRKIFRIPGLTLMEIREDKTALPWQDGTETQGLVEFLAGDRELFFLNTWLKRRMMDWEPSGERKRLLRALWENLDSHALNLAFLIELLDGAVVTAALPDIACAMGLEEGALRDSLAVLEKLQLVYRTAGGEVLRAAEEIPSAFIRGLVPDLQGYHERLGRILIAKERDLAIRSFLPLYRLFEDFPLNSPEESLIYSRLIRDIRQKRVPEGSWRNLPLAPGLKKALQLFTLMQKGEKPESYPDMGWIDQIKDPLSVRDALGLYQAACWYFAERSLPRALTCVKKALQAFQEHGADEYECQACLCLGTIMLASGKVGEAGDYYGMAYEIAVTRGYGSLVMKSRLAYAGSLFIKGNYSEGAQIAASCGQRAEELGDGPSLFSALFLEGRARFELGHYEEAERVFAAGLNLSVAMPQTARRGVFYNWLGRSLIYRGRLRAGFKVLDSLPDSREGRLFKSEALFFMGKRESALNILAGTAGESDGGEPCFLPMDADKWENGFSQLEGRSFSSEGEADLLGYRIRIFSAFLQGLSGEAGEALGQMEQLTRYERISEMDPGNRLYFYFYTMILPEKSEHDVLNRYTLMSKALKYLQQIAGQIDDPKEKIHYLNHNFWNSKLMAEAKKEKLI